MDFSRYKYRFVNYGFVVQNEIEAASIMVDAGNRLCPGIIDHHQLTGSLVNGRRYQSTSELVKAFTHLLPQKIDTFITHRRPDFDAWLAIYLTEYYLENGKFPPRCDTVLDYVSRLDSGNLNVDRDNMRTPAAVAAAIPFMFADQPPERMDTAILLRGLELIDYIFDRIDSLSECPDSLGLPWFIGKDSGFEKEIRLVEEDLDLYDRDAGDSRYTEKTKLLLRNTATRSNEYADALIWLRTPSCRLHKHWARSDERAPQGKGYILTFVPQPGDCGVKGHGDASYNRAIISVNPCSPYTLYGLAIELERRELLKEAEVFRGRPGLSRADAMKEKGLKRRFHEAWCTHDDPWYDGRSDGYTIVDAPRRGSLLGLEEMIEAIGNFNVTPIKASHTKVIYPFNFRTSKGNTGYTQLADSLISSGKLAETGFQSAHIPGDAFYPYVYDYLNLAGISGSPLRRNCRIFTPAAPSEAEGGLVQIILFSYGIGFYITECSGTGTQHRRYGMDELLRHNYNSAADTSAAAGFLSGLAKGLPMEISVEEGVIYSFAEVPESMMGEEQTRRTLYQVCNLKCYSTAETALMQDDMEYSASRKDSYVLQINQRITYGFGKGGGCMLVGSNENDDDGVRRQNDLFKERFMGTDFVEFLLSLHQRICLISLSKRLSEYAGNPRNVAMVRRLRYFIMDFMARGWFSQISRNELNVEIYERWGRIFDNESLCREVAAQLKSYEDYLIAERNRKISLISSIFVPATLLDIFYSINLLGKSQNTELIRNIPWYFTFGMLAVLFSSMLVYLSVGKSRKKL